MEARVTESIELVRRAQSGEPEALDQLLGRYHDRVLRIVRARMGVKMRQDLESIDLVQDVFVDAVKGFDRFEVRDEASLIHWLAKLAEREVADRGRFLGRKRRDRSRENSDAEDSTEVRPDPVDDRTGPLDAVARGEDREFVDACLEELPDGERELVILRDFEGHPWARVAELTGRPTADAARVAYNKAIVRLGMLLRRRDDATDAADGT